MTKLEIVKEVVKIGIVFVNDTPENFARRHTKDDLLRWAEGVKDFMAMVRVTEEK